MIGYRITKRIDDKNNILYEIWQNDPEHPKNSWIRVRKWTEKPNYKEPPKDHYFTQR